MINFPTGLDTLTNPNADDKLDSVTVPHHEQHSNANDAIEALQVKVGINGSTDVNSLDYKVANQGKVLKGLIEEKQDTLISGTNIKTINGSSLLGSGDITLETSSTVDTLSKSFTTNEEYMITLSKNVSTPVVSVTKEVPQPAITNSQWVTSLDSNEMDVKNLAPNTTLTPSATTGEITLTLGTGDFTGLVGVLVSGNGGEAVIKDISGLAEVITDFNDTSTIANGQWTAKWLIFDNGTLGLSGYGVPFDTSVLRKSGVVFESANTSYISCTTLTNGNVLIAYRDDGNSSFGTFTILDSAGTVVKSPTVFESANTTHISCTTLTNGNVLIAYQDDGNSYFGTFVIMDFALSTATYITGINMTAITNSNGQINTEFWVDLNTITATESADGQMISYALSLDGRNTFKVVHNTNGVRDVVRKNSNVWEYNSNATYSDATWTPASSNDVFSAFDGSMTVEANKMSKAQVEAVVDANNLILGDTLDLAVTFYSDDFSARPTTSGLSMNYNVNAKNQLAVAGTDYTFDAPAENKVNFKALANNNLKIRVV